MSRIKTLLIANRGEISLRVMRTARAMGIRTVAVYSDADADAPHRRFADAAIRIGPAPVGESYLNIEAVLEAARQCGADAIHPGYGFLSENAAFAEAVEKAGLVFIGPPVKAIEVMGDKARAKRAMIEAGVPCVPGYEGEDQNETKFIAAADEIGFPVMVKAAAGGGGRGMRLVESAMVLPDALKLARSEAENAFGSGELILEKAILKPRHVEIQIFADAHGNTIHLGERDCSVQRRHQKVLEEAPCPVMTPDLREAMGQAAVEAGKAVDYRGAGTVEFLLDSDRNFYFLEMNTRLQVEHPVTELVMGLDLVRLQIEVAEGVPLGLTQSDVQLNGHAIEARLYAEDPAQDFQPATGRIALWTPPKGEGVRCDDGIETGGEVSPFYDAMLAKIMAWGETREIALTRLAGALDQAALLGVTSNQAFLADAISQPAFAAGDATTAFIAETWGEDGYATRPPRPDDAAIAAVLLHRAARKTARTAALDVPDELLDWSSVHPQPSVADFETGMVRVFPQGGEAYRVEIAETVLRIEVIAEQGPQVSLSVDGLPASVVFALTGEERVFVKRGVRSFEFANRAAILKSAGTAGGAGDVIANMHGTLQDIFVKSGDRVQAGDRVAVLEAMKMQHQLLAEVSGIVGKVHAEAGGQLASGDLILTIETEAGDAGS
ncbi:acetyl-CoA carboxylase biotin carboxylase subunit [Hyphobacterium sp. HN65]|uniref:Acetyl-CoA carboxylase biotin carboxylase subunit n=1 Tax=Hyphobacterium lacteum TaxID=3116575 RepID=A0ABU7LS83_9PROT|nr:acetyl-CoA carboxylase biotin carboxylase subunit [Hyphobacterium sp. HN65]MEE2526781.1 acetyl-CoA carboxylase biotin carboxylase subunit [Hyphobacterium sp. HN65]